MKIPPLYVLIVLSCCLSWQHLSADWQWENDIQSAVATPTDYTGVFTFRNSGPSDLNVSDLHSSCDCVVYSFQSPIVKPGETGQLTIVIDRTKSKTSKTTFSFLVLGKNATPEKLQLQAESE